MNVELEIFLNKINGLGDAEMRLLVVELKAELIELRSREEERRRSEKEMARQFNQLNDEVKTLREENKSLKKQLEHISDQNTLKTNTLFGRSSEKLDDLLETHNGEVGGDPLNEDVDPEDRASASAGNPSAKEKSRKKHTPRKKNKHASDISAMPKQHIYEIDTKQLDELYGPNGWYIAGWNTSTTMHCVPRLIFVKCVHTPVISTRPDHSMFRIAPKEEKLLPGSDVSSDLLAEILKDKFTLGLPVNRIEQDFARNGVPLSRQTMNNWIIRFSQEQFALIYGHLVKQLKKSAYTQADETTLLVIRDGRAPGSKSFMWVHNNSELTDEKPIVVFQYEPTRGTDHLRTFLGDDYVGHLVCDAYCAYKVYGQEHPDTVIICGCSMHARRRWAEALRVRTVTGLTEEQINELPEAKALLLFRDIYKEESKLKELDPQRRLQGRQKKVKPKVDSYFEFLESFDLNDPTLPERTRDAISYSLNQRQYLCEFLNDGRIPIDNGNSERCIRRYASHRNSWMFCTSPDGAEALATMYTVAETAEKNGANAYYYFKYVLENTPKTITGSIDQQLDDLMPWSEKYRAFEKQQMEAHIQQCLPPSQECPTAGKSLLSAPSYVA